VVEVVDSQASMVVERPVDEVFTFLAEFENELRWRAQLMAMERLDGRPGAAGARYRQVITNGSRRSESCFEVEEVQPGRLLRWRSLSEGRYAYECSYEVTPQGRQTLVRFASRVRFRGPLRALERMLARGYAVDRRRFLESLRCVLESEPPARRRGRLVAA
jgi:uncharacterized membrane protein